MAAFLAKGWLLVLCIGAPVIWAQQTGEYGLLLVMIVNLVALTYVVEY